MGFARTMVFIAILAYLSKIIYIFLVDIGIGIHHNNVHPGKCRIVPGIICGSEQISVTLDGLAFITSGYRSFTRCNPKFIKGHLYLFDFNKPDNNVTDLKIVGGKINLDSFDPHGMDIYEVHNEQVIHVYVINHADEVESVEVFVYNRTTPGEIVHTKTITDEKFVCINDIALVDKDNFYVTNFQKYCKIFKMMMLIEYFLKMQTGNIVYYTHGQVVVVASGSFFNGITLSKSKNKVMVVHAANKDIDIYDRNKDNGLLTFKRNVFIGYGPDNIFLDKHTGDFYVGYFKDARGLAVTENRSDYCSASGAMLSIENEEMDDVDVKEIFHDSGQKFICAASSFVHYKGQYLLGTIFDKLGYCKRE